MLKMTTIVAACAIGVVRGIVVRVLGVSLIPWAWGIMYMWNLVFGG